MYFLLKIPANTKTGYVNDNMKTLEFVVVILYISQLYISPLTFNSNFESEILANQYPGNKQNKSQTALIG